MTYFTHLTSSNNQNNKLQQDVVRLLLAKSHLLIEDKEAFVHDLKLHIAALNRDYHRCTSLDAYKFDSLDGATRISIGNSKITLAQFAIYPVKNSAQEAPNAL